MGERTMAGVVVGVVCQWWDDRGRGSAGAWVGMGVAMGVWWMGRWMVQRR